MLLTEQALSEEMGLQELFGGGEGTPALTAVSTPALNQSKTKNKKTKRHD